MKTFKEYIASDAIDFDSRFMFRWNNKWIIRTRHAIDRFKQRLKGAADTLKKLFKKALEKSVEVGEYLFYSRSLDQGFVGAVKENGDIVVITILPPGRGNPKPGTEKIMVENKEYKVIELS